VPGAVYLGRKEPGRRQAVTFPRKLQEPAFGPALLIPGGSAGSSRSSVVGRREIGDLVANRASLAHCSFGRPTSRRLKSPICPTTAMRPRSQQPQSAPEFSGREPAPYLSRPAELCPATRRQTGPALREVPSSTALPRRPDGCNLREPLRDVARDCG